MIGFLTHSIPRRILASLMGIYIATYGATSLVVYSGARSSIIESNKTALNQLADLKYRQLANQIGSLATDLTAWSELEVMNDLASGDIDKRIAQTLERLRRLYELSGDVYAFDASGRLLASSRAVYDDLPMASIPPAWENHGRRLALIDKMKDPVEGGDVIVFDVPVFGTFDKNYQIGTLVMTYSWASVEKSLFSRDSGTVLVETGAAATILAADRAGLNEAKLEEDDSDAGYVVGRSAPRDGLIGGWRVVTLQETGTVSRPLHRVALELALLGLLLALPIAVLGRWLSHRLTAPIAALTRAVREIADTDRLDARVPTSSSDELGILAQSFNRMADNLERTSRERERFVQELAALNQSLESKIAERTEELETAVRSQRRLIGDISHEIKSPLARLSIALGLARRVAAPDAPKQFDRIEKEIENISALATELLTLARLEGGASSVAFASVDLAALIQKVVADAVYEAPRRASDVVLTAGGGTMTVRGNTELLRRAIENIVRNAIFYTTEGTPVEIALSRGPGDVVVVQVRDHGPGVPEAALPHLFEPFYRVDEARARETGGAGIGLAICQRAIELHGGSVRARNGSPHGLIVEMELPSA